MLMRKSNASRLMVGAYSLAVVLLCGGTMNAQSRAMEEPLKITVQVLDGRNGKPMKDQHLLVFTGPSSDAAKSHAEHTGLITDKSGSGILMIYPSETSWLQVFADGRALCFPNPNQSSFSVSEIMSKGIATPNSCGATVKE